MLSNTESDFSNDNVQIENMSSKRKKKKKYTNIDAKYNGYGNVQYPSPYSNRNYGMRKKRKPKHFVNGKLMKKIMMNLTVFVDEEISKYIFFGPKIINKKSDDNKCYLLSVGRKYEIHKELNNKYGLDIPFKVADKLYKDGYLVHMQKYQVEVMWYELNSNGKIYLQIGSIQDIQETVDEEPKEEKVANKSKEELVTEKKVSTSPINKTKGNSWCDIAKNKTVDKKIVEKDNKEEELIEGFIHSIKEDCEKFRSKNPEFFDMSFNKIISDIIPTPISN